MNPNHMPYGQMLPIQPSQRRHDGSYAPMPPQMRPHPGYPPYYPQQHMGPVMPQYPPQYAPNWYPYQQQHIHPMHQPRPHYYPHQGMPPPHYAPMPMPAQVMHPQASPRNVHTPAAAPQHQPQNSVSATSTAPVQTPPSPPLSVSTTLSNRKEVSSQVSSPGPQRVQSPSTEPVSESERFYPPVSSFFLRKIMITDYYRPRGIPAKLMTSLHAHHANDGASADHS
jgi:hypothetical protein